MIEVKLGAATVQRIEESYEPNFDGKVFFPDWDPAVVERHGSWLMPVHYDKDSGFLKLSVHSWLLTIGGKRILIDTCVGNHKPRPHRPKWHLMETKYLERLAAAGVKPDQVDMVMCTHLHVDHVGWNTQLENGKWVPTFKNAKYVWSRADYEHYLKIDSDPKTGPANAGSFRDSVLPVAEAGLMQMVDGAAQLDENMSAIRPAPSPSISNRRVRRRCSAATSSTMRYKSFIRNGTALPVPSPSVRARAAGRRSNIVPAPAHG